MAQFTICQCPFEPPIANAENLTFTVTAPYKETSVTLLINPNLGDYTENADAQGIEIRQFLQMTTTNHSRSIFLDFRDHNSKTIRVAGKSYTIKLLAIRKKRIENQDFPEFEFQAHAVDAELTPLQKEGSLMFFCNHANGGWWRDNKGYKFGPFATGEIQRCQISAVTIKSPEKTVSVAVSGPLGEVFELVNYPMPECDARGLNVAIAWSNNEVVFNLNGKPVATQHPGD